MRREEINPDVLCRLYLNAVLPCLEDLTEQDETARAMLGRTNATVGLKVLGGPSATVTLNQGHATWRDGLQGFPSVLLVFFGRVHFNAFFSGKKWALPILAWGGWRIAVLIRFSKLAAVLEKTLNGETEVLSSPEGQRRHARLSLIAAGLGLASLSAGDALAVSVLGGLPKGLAQFVILGEPKGSVWFDHGQNVAAWGDPPRTPSVRIVFKDIRVAYLAIRDEADTMAMTGSGDIRVEGLIPLADGLNVVMERLRSYLQP